MIHKQIGGRKVGEKTSGSRDDNRSHVSVLDGCVPGPRSGSYGLRSLITGRECRQGVRCSYCSGLMRFQHPLCC
jgi:hypothetical protein